MRKVEVKVKSLVEELPKYETLGAAGMDVRASIPDEGIVYVLSGQRAIIGTGIAVSVPNGYEIQVRSRSGLAAKTGLMVLNGVGTIDSDYRGEIKVILYNSGSSPVTVKNGDRIAQLVLSEVPKIDWVPVNELTETERGEGGLGSTGVN
jgi:dUTP pyrophosphatase